MLLLLCAGCRGEWATEEVCVRVRAGAGRCGIRDGSGRRVGRAKSAGRRSSSRQDTTAVRAWARQNGHELSERGRIPTAVVEAYGAANCVAAAMG